MKPPTTSEAADMNERDVIALMTKLAGAVFCREMDKIDAIRSEILYAFKAAFEAGRLQGEASGQAAERDGWVSVKDRLPEKDRQMVAVFDPGNRTMQVWLAQWDAEHQNFPVGSGWFEREEVTHWMPLPPDAGRLLVLQAEEQRGGGMTGEQLYALYSAANAQLDCSIDSWEDIEPTDREAWNKVASAVFGAPVAWRWIGKFQDWCYAEENPYPERVAEPLYAGLKDQP